MPIPPILDVAKRLMRAAADSGTRVIDATVGNGYDTRALARQVGPEGRVIGFDVQAAALQSARQRLEKAGLAQCVTWVQAGHETMADHVPDEWRGRVHAVMFNLGYLPGSDKRCITKPDTTCQALEAATRLLAPGGVITVVLYTGHKGGPEEAAAVHDWARTLDDRRWTVLSYQLVNQSNDPPQLLALERRS